MEKHIISFNLEGTEKYLKPEEVVSNFENKYRFIFEQINDKGVELVTKYNPQTNNMEIYLRGDSLSQSQQDLVNEYFVNASKK